MAILRTIWVMSLVTCFGLQSIFAEENLEKFIEPTVSFAFDKQKQYFAIFYTTKGKIECQLYPDKAPITVTNFLQLVEGGFYDGLLFHLVVPGFVIQTGDPSGRGDGGPGYTLPAEIGLKHEIGALACARIPDAYNPNRRSSGSQFYITLDKISFLDGDYTVFGQVVEGFDVIKTIAMEDRIDHVELSIR